MFEQAILCATPVSNRIWSTCAGMTGQAMLMGGLILVPLLFPEVLPQVQSLVALVAPGPPPPPPAPGALVRPRATAVTRQFQCTLCAPVTIPKHVSMLVEPAPEVTYDGVPGGVPGGIAGGVENGVLTSILREGNVPPPPRPAVVEPPRVQPRPAGPVPIDAIPGGRVRLAVPVHRVEPLYPALARQARISGVVELEGIIGVDGRLRDLRVKSGHPLLVKAAYDAVRQWIYAPTTLNEQPVEVIAPITVTFRLN